MFKRESEQPVKISFEEKKNNKEKRSLRERLSNIPVRRRVEAVLLAVVTIMASLSIDWSSLLANAAGQNTVDSGQSIYSIYEPVVSGATGDTTETTLGTATISVKKPTGLKEITYAWEVYQNVTNEADPKSGALVEGAGSSAKITSSSEDTDGDGFVDCPADLSGKDIVLLGDEKVAVVFTLTSNDNTRITYKAYSDSTEHYVKLYDGSWSLNRSGNCTKYSKAETPGTLKDVKLSGVPGTLALTEGESYSFSDDDIIRDPGYKRTLTLTEKEDEDNLIDSISGLRFTVSDSVANGGEATLTVGGTGVEDKDVTVKVVKIELKGTQNDNNVYSYDYKGTPFSPTDLYTATCGDNDITGDLKTTFTGALTKRDPLNVGSYTMTITGKSGTDYESLSYEKDFIIAQKDLDKEAMFNGVVPNVKNGVLQPITGGKLVEGVDFVAEITGAEPIEGAVKYTIKLTGKGNYGGEISLTATENSGVKLGSVVDHIEFKEKSGEFNPTDAAGVTPSVVLYDKEGEPIVENINYTIEYSGKTRAGEDVKGASIIDAGEYTATVIGGGIYTGSTMTTTDSYVLKPKKINDTNVSVSLSKSFFENSESLVIKPEISSVTYTGSNPKIPLKETDYVLKDMDYSTAEGRHYVYISGRGNYEGEASAEYIVFPSLTTATVALFDGDTNGEMNADSTYWWDYVWTYKTPIEYSGEKIEPNPITVTIGDETLTYDSEGNDNDMEKGDGFNNEDVTSSESKAYFILTLPEKYVNNKNERIRIKVEFDIVAQTLPDGALSLTLDSLEKEYTGEAIKLDNSTEYFVKDKYGRTLTEGTDYEITYNENLNAGTATITATGNGNYSGTAWKNFTINAIDVADLDITIGPLKLNTLGTVVTSMDDLVIKDQNGYKLDIFDFDDFTFLEYKNNYNAWIEKDGDSEAKRPQVKIKGKKNLTGERTIPFEIVKEKLEGLTWRLNTDSSITGTLKDTSTTVNLSAAPYNYVLPFESDMASRWINLYTNSGREFDSKNYYRVFEAIHAGTNYISVVGKGDYEGNEYKFSFEVEKLDLDKCGWKQLTDGGPDELPTFALYYNGVQLEEGEEKDYTYTVNAEKVNGKYKTGDGYTVTFTAVEKSSYTGTKTVTNIHIGKPFDSDHVFVTMYGPAGTTTVNGDNRLTYFGDNDPYFILTSNKTDSSKKIQGPKYEEGAYDDTGDYNITFEPSEPDERHKVGTTVKVTFTAKGDTWYNPDSDGIEYTYTVVPGSPIEGTGYGVIGSMLSVYTERADGTPGWEPESEEKIKFPVMTGWQNEINLIRSSAQSAPLVYNYTTEPADPKLWISYNPVASTCASQSQGTGIPKLGNGISSYAAPFKCPFSDIFTFKQGDAISATDTDKRIIVTPTSGSWLRTTKNNKEAEIRVEYDFDNASLSDATFAFSPAEYTYTGAPANVSYSVTLGGSTLTKDPKDPDFVETGYYKIPETLDFGEKKTEIKAAINGEGADIDAVLTSTYGATKQEGVPNASGEYVLVIGKADGGHYDGYNIAKFSITTATITAALEKPDTFSVTYGATKKAPEAGELVVTGVDGTRLTWYKDEATAKGKDGYYIGEYDTTGYRPRTDAVVYIYGTGNYKGDAKGVPVQYKIVADIDKNAAKNFGTTNLGLTDDYMTEESCLTLILENNSALPYATSEDGTKISFDINTLKLSDGEVEIPSEYLKATVSAVGSGGNNLTTVGKKKITVEKATGAPIKNSRTYYVKILGDISTAEASLETIDGGRITDSEIPYTGSAIDVRAVLKFKGNTLDISDYNGGTGSYTDVKEYTMTLTGVDGRYYTGEKRITFSIVYDLGNNMEVLYPNEDGELVPLAGMSFPYTGKPVGPTIIGGIVIRVKDTEKQLGKGQAGDCTLEFANDTYPGGNTASVTISPISGKSINTQTVYFSIGGNKLEGNCTITLDNDKDSYEYNGTAITPKVSVYYKKTTLLTQGSDYSVTYSDNTDATTKAKVTVTGINGRYEGSITKEFTITPKPLKDENVDLQDVPFGGRKSATELYPATPTITVKDGETVLQEGKDYDISYGTGSDATTDPKAYFTKNPTEIYTITISGKGNYTGTGTATAKQLAGTLDSASIVVDQSMTSVYNGERVTFGETGPVIKNGNVVLVYGEDYTLDPIPKIINAGEYGITIRADKGDYKGENGSSSKTFTYTVTPRSVEDNAGDFETKLYDPVTGSSDPASFKWTGSKIEPNVMLKDNGIDPDVGVGNVWTNNPSLSVSTMMNNFTVSYGDNILAGEKTGTVTLTAGGNYTGTITKSFAIGQDISYASLSYDRTTADYDGTPKSQTITVKYNGEPLTEGTAYESPIVYNWAGGTTSSPTKVGTYTPVIKGKPDGGYYGELKGSPFTITAKNKTGDIRITFNGPQGEVEAADYVCHYNASKQEPSINVYDISSGSRLTRYIDYDVTYGNNTNVGSAYVYVSLEGNFTGSATEIFFIEPYDISRMTLEFIEGENGVIKNVAESKFPYSPLFKLVGKDDYGKPFEISYANSTFKQYLIVPDSSKVKKPGKGSFTVSGTGNLFGTTDEKEYEVYGRLSESNVSVKAPVYTGTKKDPEVTVTFAGEKLVLDTDYSLRIIPYDQTATGGGNVVVTGLGYFSGSVYTKYGEAGEVSTLELRGFNQQYVYSGRFAGPAESAVYAADSEGNQVIPADKLECTFTSSVDKTACVSANATVTITSKATLDDGTVVAGPSATYKIVQRNISSCDIKQLTSDIYTGKALTPPISVSYDRKTYSGTVATGSDVIALASGRDYSLSYSNNVNPGTAVVTVTGKGNYTGTKRFMFTIKVADMATVTARQSSEGTIVSWTARPHVTGYRVLYNTNGMTKEETSRTTMTLRDAVPTVVGVQAYVKDSAGNITYGTPKYVAVTR